MSEIATKGYVVNNPGMASKEVISKTSHDYALDVSKNAIRSYINQFFTSDDGKALLEVISPDAIQFITDKSFSENEDPDKIKVQLAAFYEEVKEKLPCIMLIDSGCIFVPLGLNSLVNATMIGNDLHSTYNIMREIPITLAIASNDETTTAKIVSLIQFLFGDFRSMLDGDRLVSENSQDHWVITIPRIVKSENVIPRELPGGSADPKNKMWTSAITFPNPVIFEDTIYIKQEPPKSEIHNPPEVGNTITIDFPDNIPINQPQRVRIHHWNPLEQMIIIDDYRIAGINPTTKTICARTFGTFHIRVVSRREISIKERTPKILAEKQVKVVV